MKSCLQKGQRRPGIPNHHFLDGSRSRARDHAVPTFRMILPSTSRGAVSELVVSYPRTTWKGWRIGARKRDHPGNWRALSCVRAILKADTWSVSPVSPRGNAELMKTTKPPICADPKPPGLSSAVDGWHRPTTPFQFFSSAGEPNVKTQGRREALPHN